jgi:hypothetical protein
MYAAVERGDRGATRRPGAGTIAEFGEQILEGLHGQRLFHVPTGKVTAV